MIKYKNKNILLKKKQKHLFINKNNDKKSNLYKTVKKHQTTKH